MPPSGLGEIAPLGAVAEMIGTQPTVGEGFMHGPINARAKRFDQVASERFATVQWLMQKAEHGIEPKPPDRCAGIGMDQGVAQRKTGVERVARGTAIASGKPQFWRQHFRQSLKPGPRRTTLEA